MVLSLLDVGRSTITRRVCERTNGRAQDRHAVCGLLGSGEASRRCTRFEGNITRIQLEESLMDTTDFSERTGQQSYQHEQRERTLHIGRIMSMIGIPLIVAFLIQDIIVLDTHEFWIWRVIGIAPLAIFLLLAHQPSIFVAASDKLCVRCVI